jgi:hypothetical protein
MGHRTGRNLMARFREHYADRVAVRGNKIGWKPD